MGEAKRRRLMGNQQEVPSTGTPPPANVPGGHGPARKLLSDGEHGLVVSSPITVTGDSVTFRGGSLDPQELRTSLLFWDRLVWPKTPIIGGPLTADEEFLASQGILEAREHTFGEIGRIVGKAGISGSELVPAVHAHTFAQLESHEPGRWAIAEGHDALLIENGAIEPERGALVELYKAIPVPDRDVALADVLHFKDRRRAELAALQAEVAALYKNVDAAEDKIFFVNNAVDKIDRACADVLKTALETRFPLRLSNLKFGLSVDGRQIIEGGLIAYGALQAGLPTVGAIVGGAAAFLSIKADIGLKSGIVRNSPWRYVANYHAELFRGQR